MHCVEAYYEMVLQCDDGITICYTFYIIICFAGYVSVDAYALSIGLTSSNVRLTVF